MRSVLALVAGVALWTISAASSGCSETTATSESTAVAGEVHIDVAALDYLEMFGATYTIAVYEQDGTRIWMESVDTADFGSPNGALLYVGPCVAGPNASATNTVIVKLNDVYDGNGPVNGLRLPPAASLQIECVENQDVRAAFEFVVARSAEQGFADVTVDIDDIFCSAKVDCQQNLMPHPVSGQRGPTLVTGFACTGGADTELDQNYVGFTASLCCDDQDGSACTTLTIDAQDGQPAWSGAGFGVVDTQSYFGTEDILAKVYHNTTWLIDAEVDGFAGCRLEGFGFFNSDPAGSPAFVWNAGDQGYGVGASPAFHFFAELGTDGGCDPADDSVGVEWNFSAARGPDKDAAAPGGGGPATAVNECEQTPQVCGTKAECEDLAQGFECQCPSGFAGDPYVRCIEEIISTPGMYAFSQASAWEADTSGPTRGDSWALVTESGVSSNSRQVWDNRMIAFDAQAHAVKLSGDAAQWVTVLDIGPPAIGVDGRDETRYFTGLSIGQGQAFFSVRRAWCDWSSFEDPCSLNEWLHWRSDDGGYSWQALGAKSYGPPVWNHAGSWFAQQWQDGQHTDNWLVSSDGEAFVASECLIPNVGEMQRWLAQGERLVRVWGSRLLVSRDQGCSWQDRVMPQAPAATKTTCNGERCVSLGAVEGTWHYPPGFRESDNYIYVLDGSETTTFDASQAEAGFAEDALKLGRLWTPYLLEGDRFFHDCLRCRTTELRALSIFDLSTQTRTFTNIHAWVDAVLVLQ